MDTHRLGQLARVQAEIYHQGKRRNLSEFNGQVITVTRIVIGKSKNIRPFYVTFTDANGELFYAVTRALMARAQLRDISGMLPCKVRVRLISTQSGLSRLYIARVV